MGRRRKDGKWEKAKHRSYRFRDAFDGDFKSPRSKDRRRRKYPLDWEEFASP